MVFFFVTFFTSIQYLSLVHMEREEAKFFGGVSVNVSSFLMELYLGILGKRFEICMTTSTRSIITIL